MVLYTNKTGNLIEVQLKPFKLEKDIQKLFELGNGDYKVQVEDDNDLEYIMSLIKQAI